MENKRKLIIDTDPGVDDALAMFLINGSQQFNIEAITTVQGNSTIDIVSNNATYLKNLLGLGVEIYSGSPLPLKRDLLVSTVHGEYAFGDIKIKERLNYQDSGIEKMIEIVNNYPGEVEILALGPLTNVAKAIKSNLLFEKNVKRLVIMGGAVRVPGNMGNNTAEFNFLCDPEAADIVLNSSIDKTVIPLDVCNKVAMFENEFDGLKNTKIYQTLMKLIKPYIKLLKDVDNLSGAIMYDPVAAYYLLNPNAYRTEDLSIKVVLDNKDEYGKTVEENANPNTKVAFDVDRNRFVVDLINALKECL